MCRSAVYTAGKSNDSAATLGKCVLTTEHVKDGEELDFSSHDIVVPKYCSKCYKRIPYYQAGLVVCIHAKIVSLLKLVNSHIALLEIKNK